MMNTTFFGGVPRFTSGAVPGTTSDALVSSLCAQP